MVVRYSHLFKNLSQFVVIYTAKGFSVLNEAEVAIFLKLICFLHNLTNINSFIAGSSASLKPK